MVDGEIGTFELTLIISPNDIDPSFHIVLTAGHAIWRVCLDQVDHVNSFNRAAGVPAMVAGPHYHSWEDNRCFGNPASLPRKLQNARPLPSHLRSEAKVFEWFLAQVKIAPPDWEMPPWPQKSLLL
jgi:hypothetical protein